MLSSPARRDVRQMEAAGAPAARCSGDRGGATSLSLVLLLPVFVVLAFAGFQVAMWSHARTEARVIARDTAGLVARAGVNPADATASARSVLLADTDLRSVEVDVGVIADGSGELVVVTVSGRAPGIIRGTSAGVAVTAAIPREGWRP